MSTSFDLEKFLVDVFDPVAGERAAVVVDLPTPTVPDGPLWRERRLMAAAWRDGLDRLGRRIGFETPPLIGFPSNGVNGGDFPKDGEAGGRRIVMSDVLDRTSLVLAMTEYSMTAALVDVCKRRGGAEVFRAASMPGVQKWMEETSLAADYREVARRCRLLKAAFDNPDRVEVAFTTGHACTFDIRHRLSESDDGYLHRDKSDDIAVINLPSGETFSVPYEGERRGDPSRTEGELPVSEVGETVVFRVKENKIFEVQGSGPVARRYRDFFATDAARANIAEVAFGCNERAKVTGNVLEDEKAGFHWAYGRSDHLGGVVGLADFKAPETVVHQDIVYAKQSPISVRSAVIVKSTGQRIPVLDDREYVLFEEYR